MTTPIVHVGHQCTRHSRSVIGIGEGQMKIEKEIKLMVVMVGIFFAYLVFLFHLEPHNKQNPSERRHTQQKEDNCGS